MSSLQGRTPKASFKELMKIDADGGLGPTLSKVGDGKGANSPLALSLTQIELHGLKWPAVAGPKGTVLSMGTDNTLSWVPMTASSPGSGTNTRYDLAFATNGTPAAGNIFLFAAPRAFVLPAGLVGSVAGSLQAPAYDATLSIYKKVRGGTATKVGSIKFLQGTTIGVFTAASEISFATGDLIYVRLDAMDTTLSDVAITLTGTSI